MAKRVAPDVKNRRISTGTWLLGIGAWVLLLLGTPIVSIAFIGCVGLALHLGALLLSLAFAARVLIETQHSESRHRALGFATFLLGAAIVVWSAWTPVGLFGRTTEQAWWKEHSLFVLGALWIAGAILFSGGLLLLGERRKGWLLAAFFSAVVTGPLLLATCLHLVHQGWRSGN